MTVKVIFERDIKRKPQTIENVVSLVENSSTIGIGVFRRGPIYYPKSEIKKVKVVIERVTF